jgi:hypothetical protein
MSWDCPGPDHLRHLSPSLSATGSPGYAVTRLRRYRPPVERSFLSSDPMRVSILKDRGEFPTVNLYAAWSGFRDLGAEITTFAAGDVDDLTLVPDAIVVAGISIVHRALARLGRPVPAIPDVPSALAPFARRTIGVAPMAHVRRTVAAGGACFIKPMPSDAKRFSGHVVDRFAALIRTAALADDVLVQISDVVEFHAEYRAFVRRGHVVGWKPYRGAPSPMPDYAMVQACLNAWVDIPVACSIDVGVLASGETGLVEVNDAYALGSYGLDPIQYALMIADRWYELAGQPDLAADLPAVRAVG